jgi:SNF2 family DNA or RNA helicase
MEAQMATRLDDGTVLVSSNNLTLNTRLLQFASSYARLNEAGDVLLHEPSPKIDALMEIVDELGSKPVVVAAQSRQLIELAAARFDKQNAKKGERHVEYRLVTGTVTGADRQRSIDDFQAGRAQVMLLTVAAGGVGLTLTAADTIVFLQRSWRMIDNRQAEDRIHRIGAEKHESITVIDFITKDTVEEDQIPKLHEKLRRLQELQRDVDVAEANGDQEAVARLRAEEGQLEETMLWTQKEQALAA